MPQKYYYYAYELKLSRQGTITLKRDIQCATCLPTGEPNKHHLGIYYVVG